MDDIATEHRLPVPEQFDSALRSDTGSVALSPGLIFSDPALRNLLDTAVRHNPDALIAIERIEAARAQFRLRKGSLLPAVEVQAAASAQKYGDYTMEGVGNFDTNLSGNIDENQKAPVPLTPNYFLGFRSSWEIDLWGKLRNRKRAAYLRMLASEQGRKLVLTTLVSEVAQRYYHLQALDAELEVLQRNIALQDSAVYIAEAQKETGRTTALGVQQFRAQLMRTQGMVVRTRQQIVQVENELNTLLGRFPQPVARSRNFLTTPLPHVFVPGLPKAVLNQRPDVLQAELELRAAGADVAAAKAALLPALTLSPFIGYNSFNSALLFNPSSLAYSIAGGLAGPLINRSAVKSDISRSEAEQRQAVHQYSKTVLGAFSEIETTWSRLGNLKREYEWNTRETEVLQEAVGTAGELYKVGYASYLEVIAAQRNAIDAEINAIGTRANIYYSLVSLYRAVGGGWAQ